MRFAPVIDLFRHGLRPWAFRGGHDWPHRFRHDHDLRDELEFCEKAGIPHSLFLGRVVEPGEPLWLPEDQDKAVAYLRWKRQLCQGCGTHPSEWAHDEHGYPDEVDPSFEAYAEGCLGCRLIAKARKEVPSERHFDVRVLLRPRRRDAEKTLEELQAEVDEIEAAERERVGG